MPLTRAEQLIELLLARQQPRAVLEKTTRLPYGWALWLRSLGPLPRPFHAREVIAVLLPRPLPGPPGQSPRLSPGRRCAGCSGRTGMLRRAISAGCAGPRRWPARCCTCCSSCCCCGLR
ncbi:hypothetical protein NMB32_21335 [Stenotrophomonas sp. CD2]|nr:hypothetical protein NMB32_21335 [Stenotrophomonas sp. CD2]